MGLPVGEGVGLLKSALFAHVCFPPLQILLLLLLLVLLLVRAERVRHVEGVEVKERWESAGGLGEPERRKEEKSVKLQSVK